MAGEGLAAAGGAAGFFLGGPTGAAIGASLGAGLGAGQASTKAAREQRRAAMLGIAEQQRQFDITQQQQAPFREAGVSALGQQQALLGLGTPEEQQAAFSAFADTPGQEFLRGQQERALLRNASKIGGLGGGNIRTALQEQAFGRAQTDISNQFNRLGALSGAGQQATSQLGQLRQGLGQNVSGLLGQSGAARASGILGRQQATGQTLGNIAGLAAQFGAFNQPAQQNQFSGGV